MTLTKAQTEQKLCKKLAYGRKEEPTVILGVILKEDINYLTFKTANKHYRISQTLILSLEDTDIPFKEKGVGQ
jgi:hypothetical protein